MAQVRSIRPAVWAGVAIAGLLAPLTQKGPRDYVGSQVKSLLPPSKSSSRNLTTCELTPTDLIFIRSDPNSYSSCLAVHNLNFPKKDFIHLAYGNFNNSFGIAMAKAIRSDQDFTFDDYAVEFVTNYYHVSSDLAVAIVGHKNFKITDRVANLARANIYSKYTEAAAANETFPTNLNDLEILANDPELKDPISKGLNKNSILAKVR